MYLYVLIYVYMYLYVDENILIDLLDDMNFIYFQMNIMNQSFKVM